MNPTAEMWIITAREKAKYQEQFKSLNPQDGMITGAQAKGFFLQSQLHPLILGQIWSLADINCDGKMNITEFSIACKLINLKLRGIEIPKALPASLLSTMYPAVGGTPTLTPTGQGSLSPLDPLKAKPIVPPVPVPPIAQVPPAVSVPVAPGVVGPPIAANLPGAVPAVPGMVPGSLPGIIPQMVPGVVANQGVMPSAIMASGAVVPTQSAVQGAPPIPIIPPGAAGVIPGVPPGPTMIPSGIVPGVVPVPGAVIPGVTAPVGLPSSTTTPVAATKITSPPSVAPIIAAKSAVTPTPPQSNPPSRHMSISERAPSLESPQVEWAVQPQAKLKYTQVFNVTDRTRSGFLTGNQARSLLMQSKLPQATLAQIWSLADLDSDGRLSCDEFILAMFLCEKAMTGEKIPANLPIDWIPPSYRKNKSRNSSVSGVVSRPGSQPASRHASVSSQGAIDADPAAGLPQTSFEDKRKENFDKGQAELDRRRKLLQEQQRKEKEERERKEREEADKREKARLEAERKQQEELERQLQKQRELEMEKEEQRKRELEAKEAARKELEKQRQMEWEQARIAEMNSQKQREQERVLKQKAHNTQLNIELSTLNEKIKDLSQKICDTRAGVTNIKSIIDGMRVQRDSSMAEMSQLKARIKEQNAKLLTLTQERAKWDAKAKAGGGVCDPAQQEQMNAAFANKQLIIKQLKDKVENIQKEIESKKEDINSNDVQVAEVKGELSLLIKKCEDLYSDYDTQRTQVLEMKYNKKNENVSATSAWGDSSASDWDATAATSYGTVANDVTAVETALPVDTSGPPPEGFAKYRAVYEFSARNADEISFMPGDVILVPIEQNAEPGWLAGEINGHTGWFPETYVEKMEDEYAPAEVAPVEPATIGAYAEQDAFNDNTQSSDQVEYYIAAYPYESAEVGDLSFQAGEMIMVIKKEGDWWTGTIGTRTGMFPSNYVQKADVGTTAPVTTTDAPDTYDQQLVKSNVNGNDAAAYEAANIIANQPMVNATAAIVPTTEESRTNEELDIEVSQINTQPKSQTEPAESYSRPMSRTSSMTPGMRAKRSEIAQVIAPYEATSAEQLSLTQGQLIMIRKKTEIGWWEGELQAKGKRRQIGWFPASYVKVLQGGRNSGRNTPLSGSRIEMTEQILDKVIALYPYKAQNDDELSFDKDDIISVLGRDEAEWWRGELNGLTGLFPSNYVGPFVTSGKKTTPNVANSVIAAGFTVNSQVNGQ